MDDAIRVPPPPPQQKPAQPSRACGGGIVAQAGAFKMEGRGPVNTPCSDSRAENEDFGDYGFGSYISRSTRHFAHSREQTPELTSNSHQSRPLHLGSMLHAQQHQQNASSQRPPKSSKSFSSESESDGNQGMRLQHARAPAHTSSTASHRGSERLSLQNANRDSIGSIPGASKSSASTPPNHSVLPVRPRSSLGSSVAGPADLMSTAHSAPSLRHRSATPDSVVMTSWDKSMSPPHSMDETLGTVNRFEPTSKLLQASLELLVNDFARSGLSALTVAILCLVSEKIDLKALTPAISSSPTLQHQRLDGFPQSH